MEAAVSSIEAALLSPMKTGQWMWDREAALMGAALVKAFLDATLL